MAINYDALIEELAGSHPVSGAYNANAQLAADQLNEQNRSENIESLTGDEIFASTNSGEFTALSDTQKLLWMSFCARASIDPFGSANIALVQNLFGNATTVANLQSLRTRSISRAQEVGIGQSVTADHVAYARGEL